MLFPFISHNVAHDKNASPGGNESYRFTTVLQNNDIDIII